MEWEDPNFPMHVSVTDDEITIEWDENHPKTSAFNTWKEEDFMNCIMKYAQEVIDDNS